MAAKPTVLLVCVHNAGRSQMAATLLAHVLDPLPGGAPPGPGKCRVHLRRSAAKPAAAG
jgi:hypothetical protein